VHVAQLPPEVVELPRVLLKQVVRRQVRAAAR
jgi:hypothetical protein